MNIDFEPFKPINTSLYLCDNKFHTEALSELMETDQKYGFIVMDGHGSLYGTLSGNHREVLHKFTVDLPKKHGRGGQSALRFARLRMEKRHNYVRKVAEIAVQHFITNDRPNVAGLVLAGSADFKTELSQSDMFDLRLQQVIMAIVDVSYGTWRGEREGGCWNFGMGALPISRRPVRVVHSPGPASVARDQMAVTRY
jgi:peptide chain release factor subunit 1